MYDKATRKKFDVCKSTWIKAEMNDTGITFQTTFKLNEFYTLLYSKVE